ncbi:MAG: hypothetical protein LBI18_10250 [Planctomycetaceae bacterium]|jgi:hypothetical protein|nr:hypothetical protein [Planctomycetaceae bacterium]
MFRFPILVNEYERLSWGDWGLFFFVWIAIGGLFNNYFMIRFPILVLVFFLLNYFLHFLRPKWFLCFLYILMLLCAFSPVDVVFRPGVKNEIKILPLVQVRDTYQHIRERIDAGQRENIDYIVKHSGCSGPTFPRKAIVVFSESEYTSVNGGTATKEESEEYIQQTLEFMQEKRKHLETQQKKDILK